MKRTVNDGNNRVGWHPTTLEEYKELAKADIRWDDVVDYLPIHDQGVWCAYGAIKKATFLIEQCRLPESELIRTEDGEYETNEGWISWMVKNPWALAICSLWEYINRLDKCYKETTFFFDHWPKRPKVEAFGEVGASALEVVDSFAKLVADVTLKCLEAACGRAIRREAVIGHSFDKKLDIFIAEEKIVLEPSLGCKATKWLRGIKEGVETKYPSSEWTAANIRRERKGLIYQLDFEVREAGKAQKTKVGDDLHPEEAPYKGAAASFICAADLAAKYGVDSEALRKRLDRFRGKHPIDAELFVESQDRGTGKAKFLHNEVRILPIIESLKKKQASVKRPSIKK